MWSRRNSSCPVCAHHFCEGLLINFGNGLGLAVLSVLYEEDQSPASVGLVKGEPADGALHNPRLPSPVLL